MGVLTAELMDALRAVTRAVLRAATRAGGERGEVTTTVLLVPVAMLMIAVVVQAALVFHAQAIVDAAAQSGARAGQGAVLAGQGAGVTEAGSHDMVRSAVQSVLGSSATGLLSDVDVAIQSSPSRRAGPSLLSVTVQASVKSLIPGYAPRVSSTAAGPREDFIPLGQR